MEKPLDPAAQLASLTKSIEELIDSHKMLANEIHEMRRTSTHLDSSIRAVKTELDEVKQNLDRQN